MKIGPLCDLLMVACFLSSTATVRADEQMVPLAVSGDWLAMAHRPDMLSPADVCIVYNPTAGVAFRAGQGAFQLRVSNSNWTLPTGVQGTVAIAVGDFKARLDIDDNTDQMVNAEVSDDLMLPLFTAMDKASSMSVSVGKAKPLVVSLAGSTRATNAFRTCAHVEGPSNAPGSNPFR